MHAIRFCSLALVGLLVVLAGYAPCAFGQASGAAYADAVADLTPPLNQEVPLVYLSNKRGRNSNQCALPAVEFDISSGRVLLAVLPLLGTSQSVQSKSIPDCVLPVGATEEQIQAWNECIAALDCRRGFWYGCSNENGDMFASCDKDDCQ